MNVVVVAMILWLGAPAPDSAAASDGAANVSAQALKGFWETPDHSVIEMYSCGQLLCGRLAHVQGNYTADDKNPVTALRKRPLCGLDIVEGFKADSPTHADGGHVYDPMSGKTYRGTISVEGDVMKLRGFVGVPLFGRTETWHRTDHAPACKR